MKQYVIGAICGVGAMLLVMLTFNGCRQYKEDNSLQVAVDSMRVHDIQRTQELARKDSVIKVLTIRADTLQQQLSRVPATITSIKQTYDKKRSHINTLPVDDQVSYLSEWLSKEGNH